MSSLEEPLFRRFARLGDPPMVSLADENGTLRVVNDAALRTLNLTESDLIGANWRDLTSPKQIVLETAALTRLWQTGQAGYLMATRRFRPGERVRVVIRLSLVRTSQGTPMVMREGFRTDAIEVFLQDVPDAETRPLSYIAAQLTHLHELSKEQHQELLAYLLQMAKLEACDQAFKLDR